MPRGGRGARGQNREHLGAVLVAVVFWLLFFLYEIIRV